ncbi:MAG: pyridoxal-phosphate dependent enzyme [Minisyncoccia bacterium]
MSNFQNKIQKTEKGIWRYANFYSEFIKPENRLFLRDGNTRELENESINKLTGGCVYFKREDENETESLKGRSLAYQVSLAKQNGQRELIISTSGNAGIVAAAYCQKAGIKLYIFISSGTDRGKISSMQKYGPVIIRSKKAIRLANYLSAKRKIKNLRPSRDDSSIEGFKSIAFELYEHLGKVDAIFTFVTSGSSFIGIARAYESLLKDGEIKRIPKLFAVQSGEIFSIAEEFDSINESHKSSAGMLGVKETKRKDEVVGFIKKSGGSSFYINDSEIEDSGKLINGAGLRTSPEGYASFAGLLRWAKKEKFEKAVCILSGKERDIKKEIDASKIYKAESFEEVDTVADENK